MQLAKGLAHPFSEKEGLPWHLENAVFNLVTCSPARIEDFRVRAWSTWVRRARELEEAEAVIFQGAHAEVRPCLAGKRTLLLEEMAAAAGFPSPSLLGHLLRHGCPAFGPFPSWHAFAAKQTAPAKTIRQVLASAKWVKHAVAGKIRPSEDPEVDLLVLEKTEEEVQAGKAKGPYSRLEMNEALGELWVPVPRVGLRQGDSIRPIDDFSVHGHNGTSGSEDSPTSGGVDEIAGWSRPLPVQWMCGASRGRVTGLR